MICILDKKKISTVKELYSFYKKNLLKENKRKFLILCSIMGISAFLCGWCMPLTYKWSINELNAAIGSGALGIVLPIAIIIDQLIKNIENFISASYTGAAWEAFTFSTERPIALKKIKQVANMPEAARKKQTVELSQTANQNAMYATYFLTETANLVFHTVFALTSIVLIWILNPIIGIISLTICGLNGFLTYKNAQSNEKSNEDFRQTNNKYSARQIDVVDHYHRVKLLGKERQETAELERLSQEAQFVLNKKNKRLLLNKALQQCLSGCSNIGIAILACMEGISLGDIGISIALMSASSNLMMNMGWVANIYGHMKETYDSYRNTEKDLDYDKSYKLNYGNTLPEKREGKIEIRNMGYAYPGQETKVLKDINLSFEPGITVITGPSGSGKTTLLKLLLHTREGEGCILLDGVPLTELPQGYLEQQIAFVAQRPDFFPHRTLQENLKSVSPLANKNDIQSALKKAALADEISPHEYESKKMYELSVGQQQRENIAESFLQDKPIIIYDEATANLDVENKRHIWHNLQQIGKNKTVIIVTHDVREIESADRIVYLKEGMIVQVGTPEDLKQKNGPEHDLLEAFRKPFRSS